MLLAFIFFFPIEYLEGNIQQHACEEKLQLCYRLYSKMLCSQSVM
jgi:hypothetical protein